MVDFLEVAVVISTYIFICLIAFHLILFGFVPCNQSTDTILQVRLSSLTKARAKLGKCDKRIPSLYLTVVFDMRACLHPSPNHL
jgi:hypothetical protein